MTSITDFRVPGDLTERGESVLWRCETRHTKIRDRKLGALRRYGIEGMSLWLESHTGGGQPEETK
jgi:hypothetical protein